MATGSDKRSVSTDALETLGTIIGPEQKRDAIHLAVVPVKASHRMFPGDNVGILPDGEASTHVKDPVGIVDPFLVEGVTGGQWFWLVIYPRKITSLRHVWSHPAFPDEAEVTPPAPTAPHDPHRKWLEDFASSIDVTYNSLMEAANDFQEHDEYFSQGGKFEGIYVGVEFWEHYVAVTGKDVPGDKRENFFSCSC
jgi:hypothetical protein